MPRDLEAAVLAATAEPVTRPRYLVAMGFSPEVRYTTGASRSFPSLGGTFTSTGMSVDVSERPTVRILNDGGFFGALALAQSPAGRRLRIWVYYDSDTANALLDEGGSTLLAEDGLQLLAETDVDQSPVLLFDGEIGPVAIADYVSLEGRLSGPLYTPRLYVSPPTFNYLPRRGTVIEMPAQKITLE